MHAWFTQETGLFLNADGVSCLGTPKRFGQRQNPVGWTQGAGDGGEVDAGIDQSPGWAAVERNMDVGADLNRGMACTAADCGEVVAELQDHVGVCGHFLHLPRSEVRRRIDGPALAGGRVGDVEPCFAPL